MDKEHLFHPERASEQDFEQALSERAPLYYRKKIRPLIMREGLSRDRDALAETCAALGNISDLLHGHRSSRDRYELGEVEYAKRQVTKAGQDARRQRYRDFRGTEIPKEAREAAYAEAEGRGRNRRMTLMGGVRWYDRHGEAFERFRETLTGHLHYLDCYRPDSPLLAEMEKLSDATTGSPADESRAA